MDEDNIIKFPEQEIYNIPLGSTISPVEIKDVETEDDFMYEICHRLCAELWSSFEYGNMPDFDFDELVEFAKALLLKTALWNASMERIEYLQLKKEKMEKRKK